MTVDAQLNVWNLAAMRRQPPRAFESLRVDPNNDCNVHCVYCHNQRSKDIVGADELSAFFQENVVSAENLQFGCVMEPTLDGRLTDMLLLAAHSNAKPTGEFVLQTNGILLHKHSWGKMQAAGVNRLAISIDSQVPETLKLLRGGTSIRRIAKNVTDFRAACPEVGVAFIVTVTTANVNEMESLVGYGAELGVSRFVLREMFYHPESDIVDHSRMPALVLEPGAFGRMKERVLANFGNRADFVFADCSSLSHSSERMKADSYRVA